MTELTVTARPLAVIEAELDLLERDARQKAASLVANFIEIGRRLEEIKAQLAHGEWGPWLESRGYPQAKAVKFMKVFRAYGKEQQSLFGGEAKSKAFDNLGFQKLVQLLAIEDEGEREQFVSDHKVADISTRELDRLLKERDEAVKSAETAKAEAQAAKDAQERASAAAQRLQAALSEANASAQNAEEEHARLLWELEELRSRPIDVAVEKDTKAIEAAREAAVAEMTEKVDRAKAAKEKADEARKTAEEALSAAQRELADLKAQEPQVRELTTEEREAMTAEAIEQARAGDEARIKALEKQLAAADPDTAAFKAAFQSWQETFDKMDAILNCISRTDQTKSDRLRQAVQAALKQMGDDDT